MKSMKSLKDSIKFGEKEANKEIQVNLKQNKNYLQAQKTGTNVRL